MGKPVKDQITVRINNSLLERIEQATDRGKNPFAPTKSQLVVRGLDLALKEYEKKAMARQKAPG